MIDTNNIDSDKNIKYFKILHKFKFTHVTVIENQISMSI